MYLSDIFTISVNLAGLPGISVPSVVNKDGLPIGLQIVTAADPFKGLENLFSLAYACETMTEEELLCPL